eukprot:4642630-Amphidinium_carterae.2
MGCHQLVRCQEAARECGKIHGFPPDTTLNPNGGCEPQLKSLPVDKDPRSYPEFLAKSATQETQLVHYRSVLVGAENMRAFLRELLRSTGAASICCISSALRVGGHRGLSLALFLGSQQFQCELGRRTLRGRLRNGSTMTPSKGCHQSLKSLGVVLTEMSG